MYNCTLFLNKELPKRAMEIFETKYDNFVKPISKKALLVDTDFLEEVEDIVCRIYKLTILTKEFNY
jgi:hypothetical protein